MSTIFAMCVLCNMLIIVTVVIVAQYYIIRARRAAPQLYHAASTFPRPASTPRPAHDESELFPRIYINFHFGYGFTNQFSRYTVRAQWIYMSVCTMYVYIHNTDRIVQWADGGVTELLLSRITYTQPNEPFIHRDV